MDTFLGLGGLDKETPSLLIYIVYGGLISGVGTGCAKQRVPLPRKMQSSEAMPFNICG